jgi:hypothetical protein
MARRDSENTLPTHVDVFDRPSAAFSIGKGEVEIWVQTPQAGANKVVDGWTTHCLWIKEMALFLGNSSIRIIQRNHIIVFSCPPRKIAL